MNNSHRSFLFPFFKKMNQQFADKWCVLHSYETLPGFSESDVDMAFSGESIKDLENLIDKVAVTNGWLVLQKFWYDTEYCFYYVLKNKETGVYLAIDFLIDNRGIGRYSFNSKELTKNCILINELFPIPNHEVSFCYKIIKRIVKNRPVFEDFEYLKDHYINSNQSKIREIFIDQFGEDNINLLEEYIYNFDENLSKKNTIFLHKKRNIFLKSQRKYIFKIIYQIKRVFYRINNPSGMILYISPKNNIDLNEFTSLLSNRLDILFRFVVFNKNNSIYKSNVGFIGSTFVVQTSKNNDTLIKYKWFSTKVIPSNRNKPLDLISLVDYYEKIIIELLMNRKVIKK